MNDICTYQIVVRGQVEEDELNAQSPLQMTLGQCSPENSCISILTDQSGLIGLLRHLHSMGMVIQSVIVGDNNSTPNSIA